MQEATVEKSATKPLKPLSSHDSVSSEKEEAKPVEKKQKFMHGVNVIDGYRVIMMGGHSRFSSSCDWDKDVRDEEWKSLPPVAKFHNGKITPLPAVDAIYVRKTIKNVHSKPVDAFIVKTSESIEAWVIEGEAKEDAGA